MLDIHAEIVFCLLYADASCPRSHPVFGAFLLVIYLSFLFVHEIIENTTNVSVEIAFV